MHFSAPSHQPITFSSLLLSSLDLHSFSSDLKMIFNNQSSANLETVNIRPASEQLFCKYIGGKSAVPALARKIILKRFPALEDSHSSLQKTACRPCQQRPGNGLDGLDCWPIGHPVVQDDPPNHMNNSPGPPPGHSTQPHMALLHPALPVPWIVIIWADDDDWGWQQWGNCAGHQSNRVG